MTPSAQLNGTVRWQRVLRRPDERRREGDFGINAPAVTSPKQASDEVSDHELVARTRAGEDRAFEALYLRYHRRIAAYIQGMVHDHARSEDIAQDVFMSALRRMRETERAIAFKPWIYEIAKNACIDQFRRSRRAEEVSYDAEGGLASGDYGKLVTRDPTPEMAVENKQQLDHLRGAFGGLSETHHEILVMRELEGLSYREIGERLGMTRPAVESTLFRARRRLTEEYEQLVTGERCQRVQGIIAGAVEGGLGARDRRRLARHVSYCRPCLRHARLSGIDSQDLVHVPLRQKIAALLPLPAVLKRRIGGSEAVTGGGGGGDPAASAATWSAHAASVDPGVVSGWGKAAATAATIAVAGVGAGVATGPHAGAQAKLDPPAIFQRLIDGSAGSARPAAAPAVVGAGASAAPTTATTGAPTTSSGSARARERDRGAASRRSRERDRGGSGTSGSGSAAPATPTRSAPVAPAAPVAPTVDNAQQRASEVVERTRETARDTVRRNPVREIVEGVTGGGSGGQGGGLLPGGGQSASGQQSAPAPPPVLQDPVGTVGDVVEGATGTVGDTLEGVGDTVEGVGEGLNGLLGGG